MLSIVTISFQDMDGLSRTIESVKSQSVSPDIGESFEHIVVAAGVEKYQCDILEASHMKRGVKFIFNKDNGLYNAMNLGMKCSSGKHIIFLNGGDEFHCNQSLGVVLSKLSDGCIHLFRVAQYYDDLTFIRPGSKSRKKKFSHQGFIVPLNEITPMYDESLKINSDTFWMKKCMSLYPHCEHNEVICKFQLGGISNMPSRKTILTRLRTNGRFAAGKEVFKYFLLKLFGASRFYRILSHRAGYDRG